MTVTAPHPRSLLVAIVAIVEIGGCGDHAMPLGTLSREDARAWQRDCEAPIVEEDPHDPRTPGPTLRDGGPAFQRATQRYRCPPPGWTVYTDDDRRIVGICVDDDTRPYLRSRGTFQETVDHEVDRARKLLTAHWGRPLASAMLRDAPLDHCESQGTPIAREMIRWGTSQLSYPHPETIYSQSMCCWEVASR